MQLPADSLAPSPVSDGELRALVPVGSLPSALRATIAGSAMVYDLPSGGRFDGGGAEVAGSLFLVQGCASLHTAEAPPLRLRAGEGEADSALFALASEGAWLSAEEDCRLMQVDGALLDSLLICVAAGDAIADEPWLPRLLTSEPFSVLPPAGLYELGSKLERVSLAAGEYVVRQDEPADYYYLLASGSCVVEWRSGSDEEVVELATVEPGEGFGEEALLEDCPRATSVRTRVPSVLCRLTRADLENLMRAPAVERCDREEAERRLAEGAYWLDVRLPEEHARQAPAGSVNVPLGALNAALNWLDRENEWIVCCDTGQRSEAAASVLAGLGYRVTHLAGGLFNRRGSGSRDTSLGEFERARARADDELENALHETAVAQAAIVVPASETGGEAETPASAELQAAAERARERLEQALRRKLSLDARARHIEAQISARREHARADAARLRAETEQRLRRERDRLSSVVAEAAAAMQSLRNEREAAEARFAQEQRELTERVERARQELELQARRIREEMMTARQQIEANLQRIRTEHGNTERDMLRNAETTLRRERGRLQGEFARCVQAETEARAELEQVEQAQRDAQRAAEEERARLRDEAEQRRAQRAEAKRATRERLAAAARKAEHRMASAERSSAAALARRSDQHRALDETADYGVGEDDPGPIREKTTEPTEHQSDAAVTASELRAARAEYESASHAQLVEETRSAQEEAAEVELRVRLYEEVEEALVAEQRAAFGDDHPVSRRAPVHDAGTREADDSLDAGLLADLESQLADESAGDALRAQFVNERSQLTQAALAAAAEEKARARADLERARAHLARVREAALKARPGNG